MNFFNKLKLRKATDRLVEEQLYAEVLNELQYGVKREGLWVKAIAKSGGNEDQAKSLYIEFRVQSMKDDLEIDNKITEIKKAEHLKKEKDDQRAKGKAENEKLEQERLKIKKERDRIKALKKLAKITGNEYTEK